MIKRILSLLFCLFFINIPVSADFESELAAFPEAWQQKLRVLHEKYPEWVFVAVPTGLPWDDAVAAETGKRSLVEKYYSPLLRSHGEGHYNPSTGDYTYHDAHTWVAASPAMVDYFMNPANFLNETYIFQFEALSYDRNYHSREGVELILEGTFMHDKKISYVLKDGTPVETERKYSEVIMEAAEKSNVSPYYLASKIRTEIGVNPSGSVTGRYPGYEGLYNFYNIGANDGANPIANGLNWASLGNSYGRPWTSPEASIINGAVWIGALYISKGQNTMYFERFNIAPNSAYALYTHQYMTNVYAAAGQAQSTYIGYQSAGTLADAKVFYIPTFTYAHAENSTVTFSGIPALNGKCNGESVNLRSGPSVNHSAIGKVYGGQSVKVLSGKRSDTNNRRQMLENPYWYKIQVGDTVGYISATYITLSPAVHLKPGESMHLLPSLSLYAGNIYWENTNRNAVQVNREGVVTALSPGTSVIYAFTSGGGMAAVSVSVSAGFTDMQNHWAKDVAKSVYEMGIFNGTTETTFSPDLVMTRAMYITVLGRLYEALGGSAHGDVSVLPYLDIDPSAYYSSYVAWANRGGILPFNLTNFFSPSSTVTRGEMVLAAYQLACYIGTDLTVKTGVGAQYHDYSSLESYMQVAAAWCLSHNIIKGTSDGTLDLHAPATRAQVAQIIMNLYKAMK